MSECPTCGTDFQDVGPYNAAEVLLAIAELDAREMYFWESPALYSLSLRGELIKPEVVHQVKDDPCDSYGEYTQGHIGYIEQVIKLGGESFFKKKGHGDSYGEEVWDGNFSVVVPKTTTIVVFD